MSTENPNLPEKVNSITLKLLERYPSDNYNLLLPTRTIADLAVPGVRPTIEVVSIDAASKPNAQKFESRSGEVYKDSRARGGELSLTRRGLQKFESAAGIVFPPELNEVIEANEKGCTYRAGGAIKKADGTILVRTKHQRIDLDLEREEIEDRYKDQKDEEKKAYLIKRDFNAIRRNLVTYAETKAQNRVTRALLALKNAYTPEELAKPFAVFRFDRTTAPGDEAEAVEAGQDAAGRMYGSGAEVAADVTIVEEDPLDSPPKEEPNPQLDSIGEISDISALGYEGIKQLFRQTCELEKSQGRVEEYQKAWKTVHMGEADKATKVSLWASLVWRMGGRA